MFNFFKKKQKITQVKFAPKKTVKDYEGLKFQIMEYDTSICDVEVKDGIIHIQKYPYNGIHPFEWCNTGILPFDYLEQFFEKRVYQKNYQALAGVLFHMGMSEYDAYKMVQWSHGIMGHDNLWIKFANENIAYADVKNKEIPYV